MSDEPLFKGRDAGPARDERGRFVSRNGGTRARKHRSRVGVSGPSYLQRMNKIDLVRMLAKLHGATDRLEAELGGHSWDGVERPGPAKLAGIRARQAAFTAVRREVLQDVLDHFAGQRKDPRPCEIASEMRVRLGSFRIEQLYRSNLVDLWRPNSDYLGKQEGDLLPRARAMSRMSRRELIYRIKTTRLTVAALHDARRDQLLAESDGDPEWQPLRRD